MYLKLAKIFFERSQHVICWTWNTRILTDYALKPPETLEANSGENRPLVTDEPVKFEKYLVEI
jgi:hypothetical protein